MYTCLYTHARNTHVFALTHALVHTLTHSDGPLAVATQAPIQTIIPWNKQRERLPSFIVRSKLFHEYLLASFSVITMFLWFSVRRYHPGTKATPISLG